MHKQIYLLDEFFLPNAMRNNATAEEKYTYLKRKYDAGNYHILLNNIRVFGPFPCAIVPWDISEAEKIAIYNKEISEIINWINKNITIQLSFISYKSREVLIRIATGMLNKCNIPKEIQILFHDNMVRNLQKEHNEILCSGLPF